MYLPDASDMDRSSSWEQSRIYPVATNEVCQLAANQVAKYLRMAHVVVPAKYEDRDGGVDDPNGVEDGGELGVWLVADGHVPRDQEHVRLLFDRVLEPRLLDHLARLLHRRPGRVRYQIPDGNVSARPDAT